MFNQIKVNWLGALLARWACKLVSWKEKRRHFLTGFLEGFFCVGLVQKEMLSFLVNAEYLLSTEDVISN